MWICSKEGFFSIVAHSKKPTHYLIRWRFEEDCDTMRKALPRAKVQHTPEADYAFRALVTEDQMRRFMAFLQEGIDYPNFKDEAARNGQDKKLPAYHDLWFSLRRAQLREHMERRQEEDGMARAYFPGLEA